MPAAVRQCPVGPVWPPVLPTENVYTGSSYTDHAFASYLPEWPHQNSLLWLWSALGLLRDLWSVQTHMLLINLSHSDTTVVHPFAAALIRTLRQTTAIREELLASINVNDRVLSAPRRPLRQLRRRSWPSSVVLAGYCNHKDPMVGNVFVQ